MVELIKLNVYIINVSMSRIFYGANRSVEPKLDFLVEQFLVRLSLIAEFRIIRAHFP